MAGIEQNVLRRRFARHLGTYAENTPVQRDMASALLRKLISVSDVRRFRRILEIGCGTGGLTRRIESELFYDELLAIDLVPECEAFHRDRERTRFLAADAERDELPGPFELVISSAALQWFREPERAPTRLAALSAPGSWCAVATFGPENLREVAAVSGAGLRYVPLPELGARFEPFFELAELGGEIRTLVFPSPAEVLRHLKLAGVTAAGKPSRWTREQLAGFDRRYREKFSVPGGVSLTYHPLILIARRKLS